MLAVYHPPGQEAVGSSVLGNDPLKEEVATTPIFLLENPMDGRVWWATVHGVPRVGQD